MNGFFKGFLAMVFVLGGSLLVIAASTTSTNQKQVPATVPVYASAVARPLPVWEQEMSVERMLDILIPAVCHKESSGGTNKRPGDIRRKDGTLRPAHEWAYGPMQIRKLCLKDYNETIMRLPQSSWLTLEDCKDMETACKVFRAYLTYWGDERHLGRKPRMEDFARIWNGGPQGWRRSSTDVYWGQVKEILREQNLVQ